MSKNYYMVQITYSPGTFPNQDLYEALLDKAATYILAGKATMAGATGDFATRERDWRMSGLTSRTITPSPGASRIKGEWAENETQTFYRIFVDRAAANEFIEFCEAHGALLARVITEDQRGVLDGVPEALPFPEEAHVAQFIWPGYPNVPYSGTYPTVGPADATPVF